MVFWNWPQKTVVISCAFTAGNKRIFCLRLRFLNAHWYALGIANCPYTPSSFYFLAYIKYKAIFVCTKAKFSPLIVCSEKY